MRRCSCVLFCCYCCCMVSVVAAFSKILINKYIEKWYFIASYCNSICIHPVCNDLKIATRLIRTQVQCKRARPLTHTQSPAQHQTAGMQNFNNIHGMQYFFFWLQLQPHTVHLQKFLTSLFILLRCTICIRLRTKTINTLNICAVCFLRKTLDR